MIVPPFSAWRRLWLGVMLLAIVALLSGRPAVGEAEVEQLPAPPANIACLPFNEPQITLYNGESDDTPATDLDDQTYVSWRDVENENVDGYLVQRQDNLNGDFVTIAELGPDSRLYVDADLPFGTYRYQVRALENGVEGPPSDICRKPMSISSLNFRIFFRVEDCPDIDFVYNGNLKTGVTTCAQSLAVVYYALDVLEATLDVLVNDHGFRDPIPANGLLPVDFFPCDGAGCKSNGFLGFDPGAVAQPYDPVTETGQLAFWVPLHELFHAVQGQYGGTVTDPSTSWITEGTARAIQDRLCLPVDAPCVSNDTAVGTNYWKETIDYLSKSADDPAQAEKQRFVLDRASYEAALFWTYLMETYGTTVGEPARGLDILRRVYEEKENAVEADGFTLIENVLQDLGYSDDFPDVFRDFVVRNYTKQLGGIHAYPDETQAPGPYQWVCDLEGLAFSICSTNIDFFFQLGVGDQHAENGIYLPPWDARYFDIRPSADVENVDLRLLSQDGNDLYVDLLLINDGDLIARIPFPDNNIVDLGVPNWSDYDRVVLVVTAMEDGAVFNYAINAVDPVVNIIDPLESRPAIAGSNTDPAKIVVRFEVLDPITSEAIAGIDVANEIDITVGNQPVDMSDPNALIADAYVQGQYWLVLRPPLQAGLGRYDLHISYGSSTATEPLAVDYEPQPDFDTVVAFDRSGSMAGDKFLSAQDAARLYVDAWDVGDQFGVVAFGDVGGQQSEFVYPFVDWDNITRALSHIAIDNEQPIGSSTAIGAGLVDSFNALAAEGDPEHVWSILVLSDGLNNASPTIDEFLTAYNQAIADGFPVPAIHTVALGVDADRAALQDLANKAGGTFHFASEAPVATVSAAGGDLYTSLAEVYRVIAGDVADLEQIMAVADANTPDLSYTIPVENGAEAAYFSLSIFPGPIANFPQLLDPNGIPVPARFVDDENTFTWHVPAPLAGDWTLFPNAGLGGNHLLEVALKSDVTMDGFLGVAPADRIAGRPMPIYAVVAEEAGLPGVTVYADIRRPDGGTATVQLFDDGLHGDNDANDGVYGGTFTETFDPGSYVAIIEATGTAPLAGDFQRRVRLSFSIDRAPDREDDGLPDWWEEENGTDPDVPDNEDDPDRDTLTNEKEFRIGTHPLNADTDDGGENDGSEVNDGSDPLDPAEDRMRQPRAGAFPGSEQVLVKYTMPGPADGVRIFRALAGQPVFDMVADNLPLDGAWFDTNVDNGRTYCYRVMLLFSAANLASAPSPATCANPDADPFPPFSPGVTIEPGPAEMTGTVTLHLSATDNPLSIEFDDENVGLLLEGTIESGVQEMMIANEPTFAGAVWEPIAPTRTWALDPAADPAVVYVQFRDGYGNVSDLAIATVQPGAAQPGEKIHISLAGDDTVGGINARPADILTYDRGLNQWSLAFDAAARGVAESNLDAFLFYQGDIVMSFATAADVPGIGFVEAADLVMFDPDTGTFQWIFDGSDVGLTTADENVDAIALINGRLAVSTTGPFSVPGLTGDDEDIMLLTNAVYGPVTSGEWQLYFDGSDIGLGADANRDVNGIGFVAPGQLYITTVGAFDVAGLSIAPNDIAVCRLTSTGPTTQCGAGSGIHWRGLYAGVTARIDALAVEP